jgi:predicted metal-dependent HD superfamily phosphohydrolase
LEEQPDLQSQWLDAVSEPQTLDQGRWTRLWRQLGAKGNGLSVFDMLMQAYAEPARAYHTADHIRDCLAQFDLTRDIAQRADEVEAAIWFHDAVYLPAGSDNENRSAELAWTALAESGVSPEVSDHIAGLVLATRHLSIPSEPDAALLCDIDLSILGRAPDVFDEFERRIRLEYAWVPEPVYRHGRTEILEGFLRRRSIYQTSYFRERYEAPARANLERILKELAG